LTPVIFCIYLYSKHRCPHRPYGVVGKSDQPCAVTEYRSEFVPREGGARESFKPEFTLQSSTAPLEDETTHKYIYMNEEENNFMIDFLGTIISNTHSTSRVHLNLKKFMFLGEISML